MHDKACYHILKSKPKDKTTMMKRKIKKITFLISYLLSMAGFGTVFGQSYRLGDLYTFSDGSQGIVVYVDPDNAGCGTVAALNDLDEPYALWTGNMPSVLRSLPTNSFNFSWTTSWVSLGQITTQVLQSTDVSPAAAAVDVSNGWYIPDILQLRRLYSLITIMQDVFEAAGGDLVGMTQRDYWSSSRAMSYFYRMGSMGDVALYSGQSAYYIRPVRDFSSDTARVFWADNPSQTDTTVSPTETTNYNALVVYHADTLVLTSTVTVHPKYDGDTLMETVFVSPMPYTSQVNPLFDQLDISQPGEHLFQKLLQSVHGCDSAATLVLTVQDQKVHTETWCSPTEAYYYAPFDSVFLPGTLSGRYEHHGSKEVDGVVVDTTAYLDLVVLPVYEVFDTLFWCMHESEESLVYEPNEWVSVMVEAGIVTVTSISENVVVEELNADLEYVLKMRTVHGCDSLVYLHFNIHEVIRDTVFYELPITNVVADIVSVACQDFTGITEPGTYVLSDTLVDIHGCDSIVTVVLTVIPCEVDFSITCPPDIYDTLAFGDCVMAIYPERIGTPTVVCDQEWPFIVSNDIPEEMFFAEGESLITWIVTDSLCGISTECQQRVFIAFPQCPEAVDCEGNVYQSVRIGCDCWTQRNLESTKYSDCTDIPDVYEYASWRHPDTAANVAIYGRHYTFAAAVRDSADNGHGHIQGICPDGWYLPTPEKYAGLNTYGELSLKSPHYWIDGGGDNSSGFSALPAGFFNGEKNRFEGMLSEAYFWSTQIVNGKVGESLFMIRYHCEEVLEVLTYNGLGYSIRCVKER